MVKNPPANAGDLRDSIRSLHREDSLEEGLATLCSTVSRESHGQRSLAAPVRRIAPSPT